MNDTTLSAVTTPLRDLRDEVWVRVYTLNFCGFTERYDSQHAAKAAGMLADQAVAHMPIPAHRKPEGQG